MPAAMATSACPSTVTGRSRVLHGSRRRKSPPSRERRLRFVERAVFATELRLVLLHAQVRELLAKRVAVEPEDLGGLQLIAARVREHEVEERAFHARDDLLVEIVDGIAVDASE